MRKTLMLLAATSALSAAVAIPAWSAMKDTESGRVVARMIETGTAPFLMASDDHDDDRDRGKTAKRGRDHDDDEEEDDDDDERGGAARNPAPAGAVAPPSNGLFGTGAPPQVRVN